MQDHHWNKKICIKHQDFVIFSSTDCQVLHYFHMHCGQQPHVGFHQQLQKVNFYVKIELSSNVSVTSMHINYTILYKWNMMRKIQTQNKTKQKKERNTQCVHQQSEYPSVIQNFPIIITKTTACSNKTHSKLLSHGH